MRRYYRRKAHGELRGELGYSVFCIWAAAVAFAASGLSGPPSATSVLYLALAPAFAALGWGLWRGRAWTRWPTLALPSTGRLFSIVNQTGSAPGS
jgi:hypothetical protein